MKKLLLLLAALLLSAGAASAQSLLNNLKRQAENAIRNEANKAVNDAKRNARNAVTNGVRGAVNNAKNGVYSNNGNNGNTNQQLTDEHNHATTNPDKETWVCPTCGKDDNEGSYCANCGTDRPDGNALPPEQEASAGVADAEAFVPGSSVIFEDRLAGETIDADPSRWELLAAAMYECYVTKQAGEPAILLTGFHSDMKPKIRNEAYLPESFTVEMDLWYNEKVESARSHALEINFGSEDVLEEFSAVFHFCADAEESGYVGIRYWKRMIAGENLIEEKDRVRELLKPGAWNHAAVSYDKGTVVLYVNGESVLKVTEQKQPTYLRVDGIASGNDKFLFRNFRIAAR